MYKSILFLFLLIIAIWSIFSTIKYLNLKYDKNYGHEEKIDFLIYGIDL